MLKIMLPASNRRTIPTAISIFQCVFTPSRNSSVASHLSAFRVSPSLAACPPTPCAFRSTISRDFEPPKFPMLDRGNRRSNQGCRRLNPPIVVRGKFKNGDLPSREILLIAHVLIRRDEYVEFSFCTTKEVSILEASPAAPLRRLASMSGEELVHGPWNALVQKDFHDIAGANSANSDVSKTRRANSRVTDGKHSRNSSRV